MSVRRRRMGAAGHEVAGVSAQDEMVRLHDGVTGLVGTLRDRSSSVQDSIRPAASVPVVGTCSPQQPTACRWCSRPCHTRTSALS
jgi:hypothetical protein